MSLIDEAITRHSNDNNTQSLEQSLRHLYPKIKAGLQLNFVPNYFRYQSSTPGIALAQWQALERTLLNGVIPRTIKEMICAAIAAVNHCRYCEVAHLVFCKKLGVNIVHRDGLLNNFDAIEPARTRFIISLAVRLSQHPNTVTRADNAELARHGIRERELQEVVSTAAYASAENIIAQGLSIPIDAGFFEILGHEHPPYRRRSTGS